MSVDIEPSELGFRRPFSQEVSEILKIKNPNSTPVAFKVKTTAPKQYCVRPNSGRIEPGKSVEVTVLLQAMKAEPPMDAKCRDKFLVQSVAVTADKEFSNIGAIWQHVDNAEKSTVQEKKIRVVFLPAGTSNLTTPPRNGVNGNHENATPESAPPAYTSPQSTFVPNSTEPLSKLSDKPADSKSLGDARASVFNPASSSRDTFSTPASQRPSSSTVEELQSKLAAAEAKIASYANEGGLRLRKAASNAVGNADSGNVGAVVHQAAAEGVSVQITAALCLLSFLIAYFLF